MSMLSCSDGLVSGCRQAVYTPQEVSSHIVRHLVHHAEEALGSPICDAVISGTGACHTRRLCSPYHGPFRVLTIPSPRS